MKCNLSKSGGIKVILDSISEILDSNYFFCSQYLDIINKTHMPGGQTDTLVMSERCMGDICIGEGCKDDR